MCAPDSEPVGASVPSDNSHGSSQSYDDISPNNDKKKRVEGVNNSHSTKITISRG